MPLFRLASSAGRSPGGPLRRLTGLALVMIVTLTGGTTTRASQSTDVVDLYDGVLPELRDVVAERAGALDEYVIAATFDPDGATIGGRVDVTFINRTGAALSEIYLRLYPNDSLFLDAGMEVERLRVGKENIADPAALRSGDGSVLRAPLAASLAPGDDVRLRIDFVTSLLTGPFDLGSFLGQDAWSGTWLLSDWHPVVAPWLPESGWYLDPLAAESGPAVFENALYDVTLLVPDTLVAIASGTEVAERERGRAIERRWVTGPMRTFVVVADDDYSEFTEVVNGTLVTAYADWQDAAMVNYARLALDIAADTLAAYAERFGPYPYTELDVVLLPYLGGSGFAVPGMIFVSVYWEAVDPDGNGYVDYKPDRTFFSHAVAHEVGHQWWGVSVASDYRSHTFMVEGLTNYLAVEFRRWSDGDEVAAELITTVVAPQYLDLLAELGDQVADRTGLGALGEAQIGIIYGKATLGFLAIHRAIGDAAFYAALAAYADAHAFGITGPADLLAAFETAAGSELDDLWRHWFEAAETTPAEVETLIAA